MFCKKCGKQIDDDSIFCKFCGTTLKDSLDTKPSKILVDFRLDHSCRVFYVSSFDQNTIEWIYDEIKNKFPEWTNKQMRMRACDLKYIIERKYIVHTFTAYQTDLRIDSISSFTQKLLLDNGFSRTIVPTNSNCDQRFVFER